jgi:hypothetical protein
MGQIPSSPEFQPYDKVYDLLNLFFNRNPYSNVEKERAFEIAEKIRPHIQGRSPNSVAAGILNYLKKKSILYSTMDYIAMITRVNPATVNDSYKEIVKLERFFT